MDHVLISAVLALLVLLGVIGVAYWMERRKRDLPEIEIDEFVDSIQTTREAVDTYGSDYGGEGGGDAGGDIGGDD
jgi:hypothetical protein